MCLAFLLSNCLEKYLFVLAFNRDEVLDRDASSCHYWEDHSGLVGGRDCVGGGTWLCAHVSGRVAFVTNVRCRGEDPAQRAHLAAPTGPSRGELPVKFATGAAPPNIFLENLARRAADYPGFNLVVADFSVAAEAEGGAQVHYLTNAGTLGVEGAPEGPILLPPGVHGLSNAVLDSPWPKVAVGRRRFDDLVGAGAFDGPEFPWDDVFAIMRDPKVLETDPGKLPDTGYGAEFEAAASAIFMAPGRWEGVPFGTRSVTVLAVPRDGSPAELREQYMTEAGGWAEERHRFHMALARHLPPLD